VSTETADILDEAANVIRRNGWTNCGDYYDEIDVERIPSDCPVCTIGAIAVAAGEEPDQYWRDNAFAVQAAEAVFRHLDLDRTDNLSSNPVERLILAIGGWNDVNAHEPEQVIAALEAAARAERERAS
jgi:hypothetical protein